MFCGKFKFHISSTCTFYRFQLYCARHYESWVCGWKLKQLKLLEDFSVFWERCQKVPKRCCFKSTFFWPPLLNSVYFISTEKRLAQWNKCSLPQKHPPPRWWCQTSTPLKHAPPSNKSPLSSLTFLNSRNVRRTCSTVTLLMNF